MILNHLYPIFLQQAPLLLQAAERIVRCKSSVSIDHLVARIQIRVWIFVQYISYPPGKMAIAKMFGNLSICGDLPFWKLL